MTIFFCCLGSIYSQRYIRLKNIICGLTYKSSFWRSLLSYFVIAQLSSTISDSLIYKNQFERSVKQILDKINFDKEEYR